MCLIKKLSITNFRSHNAIPSMAQIFQSLFQLHRLQLIEMEPTQFYESNLLIKYISL